MKLDTKSIVEPLHNVLSFLRQHAVVVCIILFAFLYGYVLTQISSLSQQEPSDTAVSQELQSVSRPRIDPEVAKTMESLQDQNVNTQAIFQEARENPFTE